MSIVLASRVVGYLLAFSALFVIERLHGTTGLSLYGLLLLVAGLTRYVTLGLPDLYLLRASTLHDGTRRVALRLYLSTLIITVTALSVGGLFSLTYLTQDYFSKFDLAKTDAVLILYVILVRGLSALSISSERADGNTLVLSLSYILPYLFEIACALFFDDSSSFGRAIFMAHGLAHAILIAVYIFQSQQRSVYLNAIRLIGYAPWKRIRFRLIVKRSFVLLQFAITVYGGALLLRFLASSELPVTDFAVFTIIFASLQATQSLANTPITVVQATLVRITSELLTNSSDARQEEIVLYIKGVQRMVLLIWAAASCGVILLEHQSLFVIPDPYATALMLWPIVLIGCIILDVSFFAVLILQVSGEFKSVLPPLLTMHSCFIFLSVLLDWSLTYALLFLAANYVLLSAVVVWKAFTILRWRGRRFKGVFTNVLIGPFFFVSLFYFF